MTKTKTPRGQEYFLPPPEVCPYQKMCDMHKALEGEEVMLCEDLNYVGCPTYATTYRLDSRAVLKEAILDRLSQLEIIIGDNVGVEDVIIHGFDDGTTTEEEQDDDDEDEWLN